MLVSIRLVSARENQGTKKAPRKTLEAFDFKWCRKSDLNRYVVANARF